MGHIIKPYTFTSQTKILSAQVNTDFDTLYTQSNAHDDQITTLTADVVQRAYNVKSSPYNAVGDGVADDTTAIQATINAATSAGGGIVFLPKGTYKISAPLMVTGNNITIVGIGYGSVLYRVSPALTSHGIYVTGNNCIVRDLKIYRDNNDTTWYADKSITFQSNPTGSIGPTGGRVLHVYTDGFNYGVYGEQATDILAMDCDIHNHTFGTNQGTGMAVTTCTQVRILHNRIYPLAAGASEHNVYPAGCTDVLIQGNLCKDPATANIEIWSGNNTNIRILGNTLQGNGHSGVLIGESGGQTLTHRDIIIEGNLIQDCTNTSVAGRGVGITISGHYLYNIKVANNIIRNTSEMSINLQPAAAVGAIAKNIDILGNTLENWSKDYSGTYHGITLGGSGETLDSVGIKNNNFYPSAASNSTIIWGGTLSNIVITGNNGGDGSYTGKIPYFGVYSTGVINQWNSWNYIAPSTTKPTGTYTKRGVRCLNSAPGATVYEGWVCVSDNAVTDIWKGYGLIET